MSNHKKQLDSIPEESEKINVKLVNTQERMTLEKDIESLYGQNAIVLQKYSLFEFNLIKDLDLSNRRLTDLPIELSSLSNLAHLNLSNNDFIEIPRCLLEGMKSIEILDVSKNKIKHIRKQPACVASLKILRIQSNCIEELPEWIFCHSIREIYLGGNGLLFSNENCSINLTEYKSNQTVINDNNFSNCSPSLEVIDFGLNESNQNDNSVDIFPFHDILECSRLKHLNLENVQLSSVGPLICQFQNLITVNLSNNVLMWLPQEFCNLNKMKECILSHNNIMFLPEDFGNLHSLKKLHLNDNNLESLPASVKLLICLEELDIYSNCLKEMPDIANHVEYVDAARNYFDEPYDDVYVKRKQNIRQKYNTFNRSNGSKEFEDYKCSNLGESGDTSEDDDTVPDFNGTVYDGDENWDTDDYWEPPVIIKCDPSTLNTRKEELSSSLRSTEYCLSKLKYMDGQFEED